MILMSIIIMVSHILLYTLLPSFYIQQKNQGAASLADQLEKDTEGKPLEEVLVCVTKYNEENDVSITVKSDNQTYIYFGPPILNNEQENVVVSSKMVALDQSKVDVEHSDEQVRPKNNSKNSDSFTTDSTVTIKKYITLANQVKAEIIINMSLQPVSEASEVMFQILPFTFGISIMISLCAAIIYARVITKPIKAICTSTKLMEKLDKDAKCIVSSKDEIGELAMNINLLYASLQQTILRLEHEIAQVSEAEQIKVDFLRSASHELKTPLTSLSVILESMMLEIGKYKDYPTYLKKCHNLVCRLSNMVKEILDASSLEGIQIQTENEMINLSAWIKRECDFYQLIALSKGIKMNVSCNKPFMTLQNTKLLHKVISNILANAVQYTEKEGSINVYMKHAVLYIDNVCTPIEEHHLTHLKEAFYRPDFSRSQHTGGNGLGLYIVDQILKMLQLSYTFTPYEKGMRFTIDFTET